MPACSWPHAPSLGWVLYVRPLEAGTPQSHQHPHRHPLLYPVRMCGARDTHPHGMREVKPQRLQDQAHHSHAVGSPSRPGDEEEEEEGEAMPLFRMPSPAWKASGWCAPCRADGLTVASPRSAAGDIWRTCFGLCRPALQMAGRGGVFFPQFLVEEEPTTGVSHKERLIPPCP